jgi:HD-GYP domain-containing protein (c-di-GMP phosphodiesterase class II)
MDIHPEPTAPDPSSLINDFCLAELPRVVKSVKSRCGWLALLENNSATHLYAFDRKGVRLDSHCQLEPSWRLAIEDGIAQTIHNRNPFTRTVVVPYYAGEKAVLVFALSGRLWPFGAEDIAQIAAQGSKIWRELEHIRYITQLEQAYEMTIYGWARSLEERERPAISGHYHLAALWAAHLGRELGLSETMLNHLRRGAVLHDVGKMSIPDQILHKTGPLTPDEWAIMRRHPILGAELVAGALFLAEARDVILYHHERWDGKGYPHGLKGGTIPLLARIFSIVDVYEALIIERPFSPAWPRDMAIAYVRQEAGHQFDPAIVEKFLSIAKSFTIP